jgi:GNAT acetyltransferase-like protein
MNSLRAKPVEIKWHSGLPIYASEAFLKSVGDEYGWLGGVDCQGQLHCILPYNVVRKAGFRMVRFRAGTVSLAGELDLAEERAFLNSVLEHFRSARADMIIPSGNTALFRTYPNGAISAPYGTFIKDLTQSEEALLREVRKTYRHNIRKAREAGVEIKCGLQYLDNSYHLIESTLKRSGSNFRTLEEFKERILGLGEYVKIFVAEHEGIIQGCMVSPFSEHTAYNCYAGSRAESVLGAMHLLHWEAIRQFRALGVKRFDFQGVRINPEKGSKQEGIKNYKQGFGGRLVQGYMWKYSFRPLKWIVYSLGVRLLTGGDIVDQEHNTIVANAGNGPERSPLAQGTPSLKAD